MNDQVCEFGQRKGPKNRLPDSHTLSFGAGNSCAWTGKRPPASCFSHEGKKTRRISFLELALCTPEFRSHRAKLGGGDLKPDLLPLFFSDHGGCHFPRFR